jgi:DNA-binding LytR/AlgR family response regulator
MEKKIHTVLLADDDPTQLCYLSTLITRLRPDWQIVAKATTSEEVAVALSKHNPWLAILDVSFADTTSLEIVRSLRDSYSVIYVTGDSRFAADAFTSDAIDFVLKPVSNDRFEQALRKAEAYANAGGDLQMPSRQYASSLRMIRGEELLWASLADVRYFQAHNKYTRVVIQNKEGLIKVGLTKAVQHVNTDQFWRISRSVVLNVVHMVSAKRDDLGRLTIKVNDRNESLYVSKPYEHLFRDGFS